MYDRSRFCLRSLWIKSKWQDDIKHLTIRFGEIAAEKGFIIHDQIEEALNMQKENAFKGLAHRRIGSVLFRRGYMTIEQVVEVLSAVKVKSDSEKTS